MQKGGEREKAIKRSKRGVEENHLERTVAAACSHYNYHSAGHLVTIYLVHSPASYT